MHLWKRRLRSPRWIRGLMKSSGLFPTHPVGTITNLAGLLEGVHLRVRARALLRLRGHGRGQGAPALSAELNHSPASACVGFVLAGASTARSHVGLNHRASGGYVCGWSWTCTDGRARRETRRRGGGRELLINATLGSVRKHDRGGCSESLTPPLVQNILRVTRTLT
jgi:hypothetical protein